MIDFKRHTYTKILRYRVESLLELKGIIPYHVLKMGLQSGKADYISDKMLPYVLQLNAFLNNVVDGLTDCPRCSVTGMKITKLSIEPLGIETIDSIYCDCGFHARFEQGALIVDNEPFQYLDRFFKTIGLGMVDCVEHNHDFVGYLNMDYSERRTFERAQSEIITDKTPTYDLELLMRD